MNYREISSDQINRPQPPPTNGVPDSDAWRDAILFAEGYFEASGADPELAKLVLQDMAVRREIGITKYDCPLQYATNRDNVIDGYQETLDGFVYDSAAIDMTSALRPEQRTIMRQIRQLRLKQLLLARSL